MVRSRLGWVGLVAAVSLSTGCYRSHQRPVTDAPRDAGVDAGTRAPLDAGSPTLTFDRDIDPIFLAVDDASFFWVSRSREVMAAPKTGGPVRRLLGPRMTGWSLQIFLDGDFVHLYADDTIFRVPKSGGPATELGTGIPGSFGTLAFDERFIYFAESGCEVLGRMRRDGSSLETVDVPGGSFGGGQTSMVVEGGRLYCGNGPQIYVIDTDFVAPPSIFVDGEDNLGTLAIDATRLYWLDNDTVPGRSLNISMAGRDDAIVVDLFEAGQNSAWMDFDAARGELFWVNGHRRVVPDADVYRVHVASGDVETVAADRVAQGGIAHDDDYLYWTEAGSIERQRR